MFTPEGYWSWHDVIDEADTWTQEILIASFAPESSILLQRDGPPSQNHAVRELLIRKIVESEKVENLSEARFALGLLKLWILANFMDLNEAVLCSPTGITLRCPPLLKAHGDALDWWTWPLDREKISAGEASTYFHAFQKHGFRIKDAENRFCAIDYETGDIRLKFNTKTLLGGASYGHGSTSHVRDRFIDEQIRPIVGWSICWNPDDLPETHQDLYDSLGFSNLDWKTFNLRDKDRSKGPTAHENILECIFTAFPDGKNGATWEVVQERVGYSRRSIVTALKREGKYSDWANRVSSG